MAEGFLINELSNQLDPIWLTGRLDGNLLTIMFLINKITTFTTQTSGGLETSRTILNHWWALDAFGQSVVHKIGGYAVVASELIRTKYAALLFGAGTAKTGFRVFKVPAGTWDACSLVKTIITSFDYWGASRTFFSHRIKNIRWLALNALSHANIIQATLATSSS